MKIKLNGYTLSNEQVEFVAKAKKGEIEFAIDDSTWKKVLSANEMVNKIVAHGKPVYGINTGFGALSGVKISDQDLNQLQYNILRSHAVGVGIPFSCQQVRAMMLLRANCLISGNSGITPNVLKFLLTLLELDIVPVVPTKGSVGASGDLAPLSHMALPLIGEGEVFYQGNRFNTQNVFDQLGLKAVTLGPKDGLALINGTAVMAALGSLAITESQYLFKVADVCAALTNEAVRGTDQAYDKRISELKPHPGQIAVCSNLNRLLGESEIRSSHAGCGKIQDPYSLRCVPQVHGACRQTLKHAEEVIGIELNAVTDNPLIFVDQEEVLSGGNFHGEALALVMDYLAMGLAELCNISERRVEKMMNPHFSDLPPFLTKNSGLNSGLMIAQVTSAALASENKYLCHPASVDSIPTSTDKEDHVSMGVTAARKLHEVMGNLKHCLSIELLCNTQALDLLSPLKTNPSLQCIYDSVRSRVPKIEQDRAFYKDIEAIAELINERVLLLQLEEKFGVLQ